jgi:hypothetical protein
MSSLKTLLYLTSAMTLCTAARAQSVATVQQADSIMLEHGFVVKPLATQILSDDRALSAVSGYFIGQTLYADSAGYHRLKQDSHLQTFMAHHIQKHHNTVSDKHRPLGHYDIHTPATRYVLSLNHYVPNPGSSDSSLVESLQQNGLDIAMFNEKSQNDIYDRVPNQYVQSRYPQNHLVLSGSPSTPPDSSRLNSMSPLAHPKP